MNLLSYIYLLHQDIQRGRPKHGRQGSCPSFPQHQCHDIQQSEYHHKQHHHHHCHPPHTCRKAVKALTLPKRGEGLASPCQDFSVDLYKYPKNPINAHLSTFVVKILRVAFTRFCLQQSWQCQNFESFSTGNSFHNHHHHHCHHHQHDSVPVDFGPAGSSVRSGEVYGSKVRMVLTEVRFGANI